MLVRLPGDFFRSFRDSGEGKDVSDWHDSDLAESLLFGRFSGAKRKSGSHRLKTALDQTWNWQTLQRSEWNQGRAR